MKRGKKYQDAVKAYDRSAQYDVAEAIDLVKKNATAKFDETIELHLRTGCDGRHAEQQIRGAVVRLNVLALLFIMQTVNSPCIWVAYQP